MSKAFCFLMIATAIASFASCDSRKKLNVQEFEDNFRAAVAIEKYTYDYGLPQSFAHTTDPYGLAKRAIEIFDEEIAKGNLVVIEPYDNPLAISEKYGKTLTFIGKDNHYYFKNGLLYFATGGWSTVGDGKIFHIGGSPVYFVSQIDNYKKYFQDTYGISEELMDCLGDLSYTKRTKHFIEDYENTVLSLTKPELVSESESAIVHRVKDINSGYVFYVTQEWSADGATSKKSFKFKKE
ncbi:hypothetical protein [Dysgonomonas termitidis]|uniref:Lipoprotein n=1 Tax=Dysgonomonas termitidis TaxID=1516126 RepID=A0ABV9KXK9_9BACT